MKNKVRQWKLAFVKDPRVEPDLRFEMWDREVWMWMGDEKRNALLSLAPMLEDKRLSKNHRQILAGHLFNLNDPDLYSRAMKYYLKTEGLGEVLERLEGGENRQHFSLSTIERHLERARWLLAHYNSWDRFWDRHLVQETIEKLEEEQKVQLAERNPEPPPPPPERKLIVNVVQ